MSIIKESIQIISEPLAHIMNLSIVHGVVPDQMKIALVVPLFKADDQLLFTNRPVSVLSSFSKFLERIVYNRLYDYLNNLHMLYDNQFGFIKNSSTTLALIDLHETISSAIDPGKLAVGIFLDLSKAFDTVNFVNVIYSRVIYLFLTNHANLSLTAVPLYLRPHRIAPTICGRKRTSCMSIEKP